MKTVENFKVEGPDLTIYSLRRVIGGQPCAIELAVTRIERQYARNTVARRLRRARAQLRAFAELVHG